MLLANFIFDSNRLYCFDLVSRLMATAMAPSIKLNLYLFTHPTKGTYASDETVSRFSFLASHAGRDDKNS